jgi:hypothetical protein
MFESNRTNRALLTTVALLATASLSSFAEKLVPAGSLIQCTISEAKLSSKTVAIGDPVLCQVSRSGVFPSGTVLSGRFEDYKDPGHLVGKGWMELVFDRMIFPSNDIVPVSSKVVAVPHYSVSLEGQILGKGHATRDTLTWLVPVLWPIDLINLPRRGPRPTLKNESRITIKVMDDLVVPEMAPTIRNQYGFTQRAAPVSYAVPPQEQEAQPNTRATTLVQWNGPTMYVSAVWYAGDRMMFTMPNGYKGSLGLEQVNFPSTIRANQQIGVTFNPPAGYPGG